ncbi:ATP-binding cassette domain-containing protein [Hoyosella rhizosphaerae]|uniref:ABC transporter domain-containing protein n=1 Tax=Hoyosella rhizosphaerae TaxID=1755582 RepID=A0A916UFL7_9ACTN|nr:ATP-binding cassette domain-containing protein [Hoyosella rhizosphaerae]MBN4928026.1 ATP-binding cassette domain-containing protein [Hoyosella rhizosphaerae]GGC71816.1 hypothetical protein GCM10011410_26050 [Hoyosella rhizosphaerae]
MLSTQNLSCGYDPRYPVISGVDLSVAPGELVALAGPSGAGKSTLVKTLAGLIRPLSGSLHRPSHHQAVSYIPQGLGLVRHSSVLRNVLLGTLPRRMSRTGMGNLLGSFTADQTHAARSALAAVGLSGSADKRPDELSGGQRRRVAVARALAAEPAVLIADEALCELDHRTRDTVVTALTDLRSRCGTAVILVEHDLELVCRVADTVCCVGAGTIEATLHPSPERYQLAHKIVANHV